MRTPLSADELTTSTGAVVAGRIIGASPGTELALFADPSEANQSTLAPGDRITTPVIGTGQVDPVGEFRIVVLTSQHGLWDEDQVDFTLIGGSVIAGGSLVRENSRLLGVDLGVIDASSSSTSAEENAGLGAVALPEAEANYYDVALGVLQCHAVFISDVENVPTTVMVIGSNTSAVEFTGTFVTNAARYVGFATNATGSWVAGNGSYKRTASSSVSSTWGPEKFSDKTATYSLRMTMDYKKYKRVCPGRTWFEVKPQSFVGSLWPVKWGTNQVYTHCRSLGSKLSVTSGTQTTWSNGVKLGSKGYVDVKSGGSYSTTTKTTMDPTSSGRYWCGRDGTPTSSSPGAIMGDSTDR